MHRCVAWDSDTENAWFAVAGVYNLNNLLNSLLCSDDDHVGRSIDYLTFLRVTLLFFLSTPELSLLSPTYDCTLSSVSPTSFTALK